MTQTTFFCRKVERVPVTQLPAAIVEVAIQLMYQESIFQVSVKYIHVYITCSVISSSFDVTSEIFNS